ncbi:tyrosine-protein phosphatase [Paenibacillus donghaensis]|uniref:tyrosine-protein phosphatase n=1 Tax=Paenibacillus donghaensis TaxID=414771 RepID=UPI0018846430|nr:tyrosine-protein phosphatase [Paenibacillus donghaensis]MBE9918155.1 tyrosine-protein phosphatase [Paenibacillus donghaensis]
MMKKTVLLGAALFLVISPLETVMANDNGASAANTAQAISKQGMFTNAVVERTKDGTIKLHWQTIADLGPVKVYWSANPDGGWKELARTYASFGGLSTADPNPGSRVYFKIKGGNGAMIKTAERLLPLQGTTNFRDLGGYRTTDGKTVKWGKLFRADELAGLSASDISYLQKSGLKTIVDYRTDDEVKQKPDPTIAGMKYVRNPVFGQSGSGTDLMNYMAAGEFEKMGKPGDVLIAANRDMVDHPEAYVKLFDMMLDPARADLVQHCTAGKDRTGLGSALMLLALGVPKETVVQDFMLSNKYRETYNKAAVGAMVKQFNLTDENAIEIIKALMDVRPEYINAAFDEMASKYGSIQGFLEKGIGLSTDKQAKLKKMYLE